jgi:hypothetical protein
VRHHQRAVVVVPDAANAIAPGLKKAAVAAGKALDFAVLSPADQGLGRGDAVFLEHPFEGFKALLVL